MKALILAAGFGTRLLPHTTLLPKPLFPIAGRPILDILIRKLISNRCTHIAINTHHLADSIHDFLKTQSYDVPIVIKYEPVILGTGGAIKNFSDFWDSDPFMVINSDILFDIDLKKVYDFHLNHKFLVTLVLTDDPEQNSVSLSNDGFVVGFGKNLTSKQYTFTGIQILDPAILDYIPPNTFFSSIDAYQALLSEGKKIKAYLDIHHQWIDIGHPERYRKVAEETAAQQVFQQIFPDYQNQPIHKIPLTGDGSDRKWYRWMSGNRSIIMVDHGIKKETGVTECDAFVKIGTYLNNIGIPTPKLFFSDTFSGHVFLEDLGDINLQSFMQSQSNDDAVILIYQQIIDTLIRMSQTGVIGFDITWTYQTPSYDKNLILEKECRYFTEAFLNGYTGIQVCYTDFQDEFELLADLTLEYAVMGLMHRDCQSRNIMINNGRFYFIDFQGMRVGPLQYDLASLLIDPYVNLPKHIQSQLACFCAKLMQDRYQTDPEQFIKGYQYACLTRNLQILGAFSFLSRVKHKSWFEAYIPSALQSLQLKLKEVPEFPKLAKLLSTIKILTV